MLKNLYSFINPLTSPNAEASSLKYGYVNTETSFPGEAKGLITFFNNIIDIKLKYFYLF